MRDLEHREDVILLVNEFYDKVKLNQEIGPIFTDIANLNWEHHLPRMYDFWETLLFGKEAYKGNPMDKHIALSKLTPLNKEHFNTWLLLWHQTLQEHFKGPIADLAKSKAENIAGLMLFKIQRHSF